MREQIITWTLVIGSVVLFIIIGKYGGLIPATFVMCTVAALGDRGNTLKTAIIIGIVMSIISAGLFSYGFQIQFPMFTWVLGAYTMIIDYQVFGFEIAYAIINL